MRHGKGCGSPDSPDYMIPEAYLNTLMRVPIKDGRALALAVVLVDEDGKPVDLKGLLKK